MIRKLKDIITMMNTIQVGHAATVMADWPDGCIDLFVTSPPYWTAVSYNGGRASCQPMKPISPHAIGVGSLTRASAQQRWHRCADHANPQAIINRIRVT
jgi:hypothetical protein